jgi:fucose 4-O-acetylase-like acetyltransferase
MADLRKAMTDYLSQKIKVISFFAMIMVVLAHAYNNTERYLTPFSMIEDGFTINRYVQLLIANGLARWGIPMYFLISGYLNYPTKPRPYKELVRKRLRTLMLPYVLWSLFGLLLYWGVQHQDYLWQATVKANLEPFSSIKIADHSIWQLLFRWLIWPLSFQLWFLRCLFVYAILTPFLVRRLAWNATLLLSVFGLMWFFNINMYWVEGDGLLFFSLGLWLQMRQTDVQTPPKWFRLDWFAAGWLAILLLKTALAFGSYHSINPVMELFLFRLAQIPGVLVIWFGYDRLMRGRLPGRVILQLTTVTFIIYGMHVPLLHIVENVSLMYYGESQWVLWWVYVACSFGVIAICILIGMALRFLAPTLFGWLTGGRGLS